MQVRRVGSTRCELAPLPRLTTGSLATVLPGAPASQRADLDRTMTEYVELAETVKRVQKLQSTTPMVIDVYAPTVNSSQCSRAVQQA